MNFLDGYFQFRITILMFIWLYFSESNDANRNLFFVCSLVFCIHMVSGYYLAKEALSFVPLWQLGQHQKHSFSVNQSRWTLMVCKSMSLVTVIISQYILSLLLLNSKVNFLLLNLTRIMFLNFLLVLIFRWIPWPI